MDQAGDKVAVGLVQYSASTLLKGSERIVVARFLALIASKELPLVFIPDHSIVRF
jgi:hypothetical protein